MAAALLAVACGPSAAPGGAEGVPGGQGGPGGPRTLYGSPPPRPEYLVVPSVPAIPGFSSAVKVGQTVYLSGQVPMDSTGLLVGAGNRPAQFRQALANAVAIVRFARGAAPDLVKITVYCVRCAPADWEAMRAEAAAVFPAGEAPALSALGVASLPDSTLLVAVDGVAVLRGTIPDRYRDPQAGSPR